MKLSVRGEYALRALLALGLGYSQTPIRIQAISKQQNIPKKFLEQILNDMRSTGIVESRRGVSGGYRLARSPDKIYLSEVIRHIEGALAPVSCVSEFFYEKCSCPNEALCPIRSIMKEVRDAIVHIVEKVSVTDLCQRAKELEHSNAAPIDFII